MSRLFLSYSRVDAADAKRLHDILEANGHNVWMDTSDVQSGTQWRKSIVEAIETADRVLLLLSKNSVDSDNVRREIDIADDAAVPILPLTLDGVIIPTSLRYQLAGVQRHDLSRDFETSARALLKLFARTEPSITPESTPSKTRVRGPVLGTWIGRVGFTTAMVAIAVALYASASMSPGPTEKSANSLVSSPLAVYLLLCAGIFALFQFTESLLRRPVLDEIGDWLMGSSVDGERTDRPQGFISMFDAVFKVRQASNGLKIPGFGRSCVISVFFALLLYGLCVFAGIDVFVKFDNPVKGVVFTIVLSVLFNCATGLRVNNRKPVRTREDRGYVEPKSHRAGLGVGHDLHHRYCVHWVSGCERSVPARGVCDYRKCRHPYYLEHSL